jgi:hypothetical protein
MIHHYDAIEYVEIARSELTSPSVTYVDSSSSHALAGTPVWRFSNVMVAYSCAVDRDDF